MVKENKKVLIVDDDESFLFILKKELTDAGLSVLTVKDGKECLALVEREKPDAILSDVLLPGLDGIDMAKKIREKNISVPVVFLTNVTDEEYIDNIKSIEGADYLIKSGVQISDIILRIKEKLTERKNLIKPPVKK